MGCTPWPIRWPCEVAGVDPELLALAQGAAESTLWGLSGRRIGVCTFTESYTPRPGNGCFIPDRALWENQGRGRNCCRILLDHGPIVSVTSVSELGVEVLAEDYGFSGRYLRRIGGCWGAVDDCAEFGLSVTYAAGISFPDGTALAMGEVACEFLAGFQNRACKLPSRAVSVARQGVTVQLADPSEFVTNGKLGLPIADAWIGVQNPTNLRQASSVRSPDFARRR